MEMLKFFRGYILPLLLAYIVNLLIIKYISKERLRGKIHLVFLRGIIIALVWIVAAFTVFGHVVDFTAAWKNFAGSSALAVAILGLAAQSTLANVFAGIAITASSSRPFDIGDRIKIDSIDPGYAYAYVINYHPDYCPYSTLALQSYLSTLDFAGTPDRLSSASYDDLDAEASSCALVTGSSDFDHLEADLVEIVYETDDSKIQEYGLSAKDFENYGWTIVGIDQDYTRYTISDDCPIYVTFTDNLFDTCLTKDEFADRMSKDPDGGLMYLYFNTDGEVVFIHEAIF